MQNRLNRLTTGISTIYVGGASDVEQVETKERADDAVNACKLALESGVVIGGGATLYRASKDFEEDDEVGSLFIKALQTPLRTIVENAGVDVDNILDLEGNFITYSDVAYVCGTTGEIRNALDDGVLDPVEVILNSLRSAVSISALILMTDVAITAPTDTL